MVAELLRLELLKTGITRQQIYELKDSKIESIVMKGVHKLVELIHSKRSERWKQKRKFSEQES